MSTSLWSIPCIGQGGDYDDEHGDGDDDGDGDEHDIVMNMMMMVMMMVMIATLWRAHPASGGSSI